ncbi:uncharacterized protein LOC110738508 [Chenopodium quinoa]|uniref:uncharacterized protein LOC110738508 n=1 Tax=Chenopodium quinoa TaxID=63459 RepID=UPI000B78EF69|nr:uncharacterized protein LOC110738508 [Chenopodium quinoa]
MRVEAQGFAAGIWIFWRTDEVDVVIYESHNQHLTVEIRKLGEDPWLFSAVYASPQSALKHQLWDALENIKHNYSRLWLIAGDFNDTKSLSERNGAILRWSVVVHYGFFSNSGLVEAVLVSSGLVSHEKFDALVRSKWDKTAPIIPFLSKFADILNTWNRDTLHNIFRKKSELWARLEGIQKRLSTGNDRYLLKLEATLCREMDDVLNQEEILWFQKSRIDSIRDGDQNTKYFHLSTLIRRRRKRIETLQNSQGVWLTYPEQVKSLVLDYRRNLFQEEAKPFTGERLLTDQFPFIEKRTGTW